MKYNVTIGMEVHAELKTASKMFCACKNGLGLEQEPNTHMSSLYRPAGDASVPNRQAIEMVRALVSRSIVPSIDIPNSIKNYFSDIPKGYQISIREPFCEHGMIVANGRFQRSRGSADGIGD
jgi:aspartyl-tRNA(Asn)/glutamyl-tRNA(Gln) amidotransferase subunit B